MSTAPIAPGSGSSATCFPHGFQPHKELCERVAAFVNKQTPIKALKHLQQLMCFAGPFFGSVCDADLDGVSNCAKWVAAAQDGGMDIRDLNAVVAVLPIGVQERVAALDCTPEDAKNKLTCAGLAIMDNISSAGVDGVLGLFGSPEAPGIIVGVRIVGSSEATNGELSVEVVLLNSECIGHLRGQGVDCTELARDPALRRSATAAGLASTSAIYTILGKDLASTVQLMQIPVALADDAFAVAVPKFVDASQEVRARLVPAPPSPKAPTPAAGGTGVGGSTYTGLKAPAGNMLMGAGAGTGSLLPSGGRGSRSNTSFIASVTATGPGAPPSEPPGAAPGAAPAAPPAREPPPQQTTGFPQPSSSWSSVSGTGAGSGGVLGTLVRERAGDGGGSVAGENELHQQLAVMGFPGYNDRARDIASAKSEPVKLLAILAPALSALVVGADRLAAIAEASGGFYGVDILSARALSEHIPAKYRNAAALFKLAAAAARSTSVNVRNVGKMLEEMASNLRAAAASGQYKSQKALWAALIGDVNHLLSSAGTPDGPRATGGSSTPTALAARLVPAGVPGSATYAVPAQASHSKSLVMVSSVAAFTAAWTAWRLTRTAMGQLLAASMMETLLQQLRARYLDRVAPCHEQEQVRVIVGWLKDLDEHTDTTLHAGKMPIAGLEALMVDHEPVLAWVPSASHVLLKELMESILYESRRAGGGGGGGHAGANATIAVAAPQARVDVTVTILAGDGEPARAEPLPPTTTSVEANQAHWAHYAIVRECCATASCAGSANVAAGVHYRNICASFLHTGSCSKPKRIVNGKSKSDCRMLHAVPSVQQLVAAGVDSGVAQTIVARHAGAKIGIPSWK
jgi:hypothetical protein